MKTNKIIMGALCSLMVACGQGNDSAKIGTDPNVSGLKVKTLAYYDSCASLESDLKERAKKIVNDSMDSFIFDSDSNCRTYPYEGTQLPSNSPTAPDTIAVATGTNLQEAGVDEGDIIKTDGKHLYLASIKGVQIFKVWPQEDYAQVATYKVAADKVPELYLNGDKLIVVYENSQYDEKSYKPQTHIDILNVTNPAAPIVLSKKVLSGWLVTTRRVGGVLHLAFNSPFNTNYIQWDYPWAKSDLTTKACKKDQTAIDAINKEVEDARVKNLAKIDSMDFSNVLPSFGTETTSAKIACTSVAREEDVDNGSSDPKGTNKAAAQLPKYSHGIYLGQMTGLLSLSIFDPNSVQTTLLAGAGAYTYSVYASPDALYLSQPEYIADKEKTVLHRFQLSDIGRHYHLYTATGVVNGSLLNQFALSEKEAVLRLATFENLETKILTLDAATDNLQQLGSVGGIGVGELLYGVRFVGDRAYVVTFKKVDPFYVVDLSDPANPTVEGELKMPGYSTYLHAIDDDHVIGLGKDADDQGDFAWFQGLKVALFDVSDATLPDLIDETILGSRGTSSVALEDHHAFTYDAASQMLALPLELFTGTSSGGELGQFQYSGVQLFKVDTESGLEDKGVIQLPDAQTGCGWINGGPRRVVVMGANESHKNLFYILGNSKLYQAKFGVKNEVITSLPSDNIIGESFGWNFCFND